MLNTPHFFFPSFIHTTNSNIYFVTEGQLSIQVTSYLSLQLNYCTHLIQACTYSFFFFIEKTSNISARTRTFLLPFFFLFPILVSSWLPFTYAGLPWQCWSITFWSCLLLQALRGHRCLPPAAWQQNKFPHRIMPQEWGRSGRSIWPCNCLLLRLAPVFLLDSSSHPLMACTWYHKRGGFKQSSLSYSQDVPCLFNHLSFVYIKTEIEIVNCCL